MQKYMPIYFMAIQIMQWYWYSKTNPVSSSLCVYVIISIRHCINFSMQPWLMGAGMNNQWFVKSTLVWCNHPIHFGQSDAAAVLSAAHVESVYSSILAGKKKYDCSKLYYVTFSTKFIQKQNINLMFTEINMVKKTTQDWKKKIN